MGRVLTALQSYQSNNRGSTPTSWVSQLVTPYLRPAGDTFSDPDGSAYFLWEAPIGFNSNSVARKTSSDPFASTIIYIVRQAKCDGESVKAATGANNIAFVMMLEGGGKYCVNN